MTSPTLTRRGLLRGATTASALASCTKPGTTSSTDVPVDPLTGLPREVGPDAVSVDFTLNGAKVRVQVEPRVTLLDALRIDLGVTGPKLVCDRGACGACTVLVDGLPRNACMMLAHDVAGANVTTVEGLADGTTLSLLQAAFVRHDAMQCGFCTSGMLMSAHALVRRARAGTKLTASQVNDAISGNLCRCGTYPHVVAAVLEVARTPPPVTTPTTPATGGT